MLAKHVYLAVQWSSEDRLKVKFSTWYQSREKFCWKVAGRGEVNSCLYSYHCGQQD